MTTSENTSFQTPQSMESRRRRLSTEKGGVPDTGPFTTGKSRLTWPGTTNQHTLKVLGRGQRPTR